MKIKLVGNQESRINNFSNFKASENSFKLIDIINDSPSLDADFKYSPGYFVFEFSINVDMQKALDKKLESFELKIYNNDPKFSIQKNFDPTSKAKSVKKDYFNLKQISQTQEKNVIFETLFKIKHDLPNELIFSNNKNLKAVKNQITFVSSENYLTDSSSPATLLFSNQAVSNSYLSSSLLRYENIKKNIIENFKKDPAKLTNISIVNLVPKFNEIYNNLKKDEIEYANNKLASKEKKYSNGNFNESNKSFLEIRKKIFDNLKLKKENLEEIKAVNSLIRSLNSNFLSDFSFSPKKNELINYVLGYQFVLESKVKNHKFYLKVPKTNLYDRENLYFSLKPILKSQERNGIISIENYYSISFKSQVDKFLISTIPPKIYAFENSKSVKLKIKQQDPASSPIIISKRIIDPNLNDREYEIIGEYSVPFQKEIEIVDNNPGNIYPNHVIYRAITNDLNSDGLFDSALIEPKKNCFIPSFKDSVAQTSIISRNLENSIQIQIENFPVAALGMSLFKENKTILGSLKIRTKIVQNSDGQKYFDISNFNSIAILDQEVAENNVYRYYAVFYFENGLKKISSNDELIIRKKPVPESKIPFEINVENIEPTELLNGNLEFKIKFSLNSKDSSLQFIKDAFESQNILSEFQSLIENNKDLYDKILFFKIERINSKNGVKYDLGLFKPGELVDGSRLSNTLKIPNLEKGIKYIYNFRICLINPLSVLYDTVTKISSGKIPGVRDINVNPQIFRSSVLKPSILPDSKSLANKNKFNDVILKGDIGISIRKEVFVPKNKSIVKKVLSYKNTNNSLIQIDLEGNITDIDYCLIEIVINQKTQTLGTVAVSGLNKKLIFLDDKYYKNLGKIFYRVILVYCDGSFSEPYNGSIFDNNFDLDSESLKEMFDSSESKVFSLSSSDNNNNFYDPKTQTQNWKLNLG